MDVLSLVIGELIKMIPPEAARRLLRWYSGE